MFLVIKQRISWGWFCDVWDLGVVFGVQKWCGGVVVGWVVRGWYWSFILLQINCFWFFFGLELWVLAWDVLEQQLVFCGQEFRGLRILGFCVIVYFCLFVMFLGLFFMLEVLVGWLRFIRGRVISKQFFLLKLRVV